MQQSLYTSTISLCPDHIDVSTCNGHTHNNVACDTVDQATTDLSCCFLFHVLFVAAQVLMVSGQVSLADATAVAAALAATQLRPKAAFSSSTRPCLLLHQPSVGQRSGRAGSHTAPSQLSPPHCSVSYHTAQLLSSSATGPPTSTSAVSSISLTISDLPIRLSRLLKSRTASLPPRPSALGRYAHSLLGEHATGNTYLRTVKFSNLTGTNDGLADCGRHS